MCDDYSCGYDAAVDVIFDSLLSSLGQIFEESNDLSEARKKVADYLDGFIDLFSTYDPNPEKTRDLVATLLRKVRE